VKVKDLVKKVGLFKGQEIVIVDHSNHTVEGVKTVLCKSPFQFKELKSDLLNATVNSFSLSPDGNGIMIHVSPDY